MSLEGLDYILGKDEVVPTVSARDLLEGPQNVESAYLRHVRTYVPISRTGSGRDDGMTVSEFERKVIKAVKDRQAPRGYLTAEYGYGKTSTALYLWQQAEKANLLVIPPFQMLYLNDLLIAIYGWVRHRLAQRMPSLLGELQSIYDRVTSQSIEREARSESVNEAWLRARVSEGRYLLDVQPADYVHFFEEVTRLAEIAGFEGVLVIPDEIQQYIEPSVKSSADPIGPLFNLVQGLATRTSYLRFGLIFVIPLKEVGVLREMRDDLLHRMRELSLDLTTIYTSDFAENLWKLLAREFDFADVANDVVAPETLVALGEIASRQELANGPRTVINAFHRMVELHKTSSSRPYTPIDLIEDFIEGAIPFAGNDQIPNVTRQALKHPIVRVNLGRYEAAIKLSAAFPTGGVPYKLQEQYGVADALEELRMKALGELVISVGEEHLRGVTLYGLHLGVQQSDWLSQTIRDFRRAYGEQQERTKQRAIAVFSSIIKTDVFKGWKLIDERTSNLAANHSLILEGSFQSFSAQFPMRRVHVRIFWEDEERKDAEIEGDLAVEYFLTLRGDLRGTPEARRRAAEPAHIDYEQRLGQIKVNLLYVRPEGIPQNLKQQLQGVWSPYDLSPLVLMNLFQLMEEKRRDQLIPPREDQMIRNAFQPELLDALRKDLFNSEIGISLGGVSGVKITEEAVHRVLAQRYPNYRTISAVTTWKSALQTDYSNALNMLENLYQRRGEVEYEATKEEVAKRLGRSSTALDSFLKQFPDFLTVTKYWSSKEPNGTVKFTLHPLESQIIEWMRESRHVEKVSVSGKKIEVHLLELRTLYEDAKTLGYRPEEIELLIKLLEQRDMIEIPNQLMIREKPSLTVDLDEVARELNIAKQEINRLLPAFDGNDRMIEVQDLLGKCQLKLDAERQSVKPDPQTFATLGKAVKKLRNDVTTFANERKADLQRQVRLMGSALNPIEQKHMDLLEKPVQAGVGYVEQVNVLRNHLRNFATKAKAEIDQVRYGLSTLDQRLRQESVSLDALASAAKEVQTLETQIKGAQVKRDKFEQMYRDFSSWTEIASKGSELSDLFGQLGSLVGTQYVEFEVVARNIRADISSSSTKLDVLPHHHQIRTQLNQIYEQVKRVKTEIEDQFHATQNRYELILAEIYPREQLGPRLTFNPNNSDESYRLLYDHVQRLTLGICTQLGTKVREEQQNILSLVHAASVQGGLGEISLSEYRQQSDDWSSRAGAMLYECELLIQGATQIDVIRNYPAPNTGAYAELIERMLQVRNQLREMSTASRRLGQQIAEISLTAEENALLERLPSDSADILAWLRNAGVSEDKFWQLVRKLLDKRRLRLNVERIRENP